MNNNFHQNLQSFLKFLFIIPVSIFITALLFRIIPEKERIIPVPSPTIVPLAVDNIPQSSSSASLNLTGPFVCDFSQDTLAVKGYIKDRQIFAQVRNQTAVNNFLIKGDCLYRWDQGTYDGEKTCGLQPAMGAAEQFMGLGLLNENTISQFGGSLDADTMKGIMQSCRKEEVEDMSVFTLPSGISFKETPLPS